MVGNGKGELQMYNSDCILKWQRSGHEGEVKQVVYDELNRLIFTMGGEGKVIAWP